MTRRLVTLELDSDVLDAVRREAARSGRSGDEVVEEALRHFLAPTVLDRLWQRNRLPEDEAMHIALEEVKARRADQA